MRTPTVYELLSEAQEKINWENIAAIAAVLNVRYYWSEGKAATLEDIKALCYQLCFQVEMKSQENEQRGKRKNSIRISSGHWTISVHYWDESPFVSIDFGASHNAQ